MKSTTTLKSIYFPAVVLLISGLSMFSLAGCSTTNQSSSGTSKATAAVTQQKNKQNQQYYEQNKVAITSAGDLFDLLTDYSWYDQNQILTLKLDGTILATNFEANQKQQSPYGKYELLENGHLRVGVYANDTPDKIIQTYEFRLIQTTEGLQLTELSKDKAYQSPQWFAVNRIEKETMFS